MSIDQRASYLLGNIPPNELGALKALWYADPVNAYWQRLEMVMSQYGFHYEDTPGDRKRK